MKSLKYLLLLVGVVFSCEEDSNMDAVGNWSLSSPELTTPANNAEIVLDEALPATKVRFEWEAAEASNRFIIQYTVLLVPTGSTDYDHPILKIVPGNSGKELFAEITAQQIDYALWVACYPAGADVDLDWVVQAKAIEKITESKQTITFTRFETEYMPETLFITGEATEAGDDVTGATPMRGRKNTMGEPSHIFEVYTTLTEGKTYHFRDQAIATSRVYGGNGGVLEGCGPAIAAPETGQYRVTVNLNTNAYTLLHIDRWSMVGDAVEGGWGGDVPLAYQGNGVWSSILELKPGGCLFRANGNWGYLLKRVQNTATPDNNGGDVIMESEAASQGLLFQDVPGPEQGRYEVTLDLSADAHTYRFVEKTSDTPSQAIIGQTNTPNSDAVTGNFTFGTYAIPNELYLLSGGNLVATLTKDGTSFKSITYVALEESKKYILNSASDGSGTTYNEIGNGEISVARDQAYQLTVNFDNGKLGWKYYNIKLFHWDEVGGGWDSRQELLMSYSHPYIFEVTGTLSAGFHSKFISPWDIQFGTAATDLTGTMTNGGPNYTGIALSGSYVATITVTNDYTSADYSFVKQ